MYEEGWDKQGADERTTLSTHTRHTDTHTQIYAQKGERKRAQGRRGGVLRL